MGETFIVLGETILVLGETILVLGETICAKLVMGETRYNPRPGSTYNANPRWWQANPQPDSTESVAAISDVDAEKTLRKSFDKTIIKKG